MFTEQQLKEALKDIRHCGDYCIAYFNSQIGHLVISMGDADCEEPFSTIEEIKLAVSNLPDVQSVDVEAEWYPDDEGYEESYVEYRGPYGKILVHKEDFNCELAKGFGLESFNEEFYIIDNESFLNRIHEIF